MKSATPHLDALPTPEAVSVLRPVMQRWDEPTRLDQKTARNRIDAKQLETWRTDVYRLDGYRCRQCGLKVVRTMALVWNRAEAHHVAGRDNQATRYDARNGLTLCLTCHRRVTGLVNDKLVIIGTAWFVVQSVRYINARKPVRFQEVT